MPYIQAEIIPSEPDPGNAGEGRVLNQIIRLSSVDSISYKPMVRCKKLLDIYPSGIFVPLHIEIAVKPND